MQLKNFPIPEVHILGIAFGVFLHLFFKVKILPSAWTRHLVSWPLIILGMSLSLWATIEAGKIDISSPRKLVTSGPYAYSRNPMYVGWSMIYMGIFFAVNSLWLVIFFPLIMAYIHFIEVPGEERSLEQKFGSKYREYQNRVRRYL